VRKTVQSSQQIEDGKSHSNVFFSSFPRDVILKRPFVENHIFSTLTAIFLNVYFLTLPSSWEEKEGAVPFQADKAKHFFGEFFFSFYFLGFFNVRVIANFCMQVIIEALCELF
jgi:hypothetical protein